MSKQKLGTITDGFIQTLVYFYLRPRIALEPGCRVEILIRKLVKRVENSDENKEKSKKLNINGDFHRCQICFIIMLYVAVIVSICMNNTNECETQLHFVK